MVQTDPRPCSPACSHMAVLQQIRMPNKHYCPTAKVTRNDNNIKNVKLNPFIVAESQQQMQDAILSDAVYLYTDICNYVCSPTRKKGYGEFDLLPCAF